MKSAENEEGDQLKTIFTSNSSLHLRNNLST